MILFTRTVIFKIYMNIITRNSIYDVSVYIKYIKNFILSAKSYGTCFIPLQYHIQVQEVHHVVWYENLNKFYSLLSLLPPDEIFISTAKFIPILRLLIKFTASR